MQLVDCMLTVTQFALFLPALTLPFSGKPKSHENKWGSRQPGSRSGNGIAGDRGLGLGRSGGGGGRGGGGRGRDIQQFRLACNNVLHPLSKTTSGCTFSGDARHHPADKLAGKKQQPSQVACVSEDLKR